jgi:predicted HTH domain antitoxin
MQLTIPDELVKASGLSETELLQELILVLFQQEKISLPKASKLLNMNQIQFQRLLTERKICIHYDVAELHEDIEHLQAKGWL